MMCCYFVQIHQLWPVYFVWCSYHESIKCRFGRFIVIGLWVSNTHKVFMGPKERLQHGGAVVNCSWGLDVITLVCVCEKSKQCSVAVILNCEIYFSLSKLESSTYCLLYFLKCSWFLLVLMYCTLEGDSLFDVVDTTRGKFVSVHRRARIWGKIPQDCRACSSKLLLDQKICYKTGIKMRRTLYTVSHLSCFLYQALREDLLSFSCG